MLGSTRKPLLHRLSLAISDRGAWGTAKAVPQWLKDRVTDNMPAHRRRRRLSLAFDKELGVETAERVHVRDLVATGPSRRYAIQYTPMLPDDFDDVVRHAKIAAGTQTFVDIGSGKGRVLLLAARYPFRRVIGVEFDRQLHETACRNLTIARDDRRRCSDVESTLMDAAEYEFPSGPLFIFMFNPFQPEVLRGVMNNLRHSLRAECRDVQLAYVNPQYAHVIDETGLLTRTFESKGINWYIIWSATFPTAS